MGVDGQDNFWRGGGGWIKAIFLYDLGEIAFGIIPFSHKALFGDRFKVDMSQFPVISRINDDLSKLEAFKVSHPSKQPDCPEESRE